MQNERRTRAACKEEEALELIRQNGMRITSQRIRDIVVEREYT